MSNGPKETSVRRLVPGTLNMDLADAEVKRAQAERGELPGIPQVRATGVIPVHVGGLMMDVSAVRAFADHRGLWVVEDAAHAFPAAWREGPAAPWIHRGSGTAAVTCFSFYAVRPSRPGKAGWR